VNNTFFCADQLSQRNPFGNLTAAEQAGIIEFLKSMQVIPESAAAQVVNSGDKGVR